MKHFKLHYPSAIDWMWTYCIYLGPFTSSHGTHFDLGIHEDCAAIVFGNELGDYYSGELRLFGLLGDRAKDEAYEETRKRAASLGLYESVMYPKHDLPDRGIVLTVQDVIKNNRGKEIERNFDGGDY